MRGKGAIDKQILYNTTDHQPRLEEFTLKVLNIVDWGVKDSRVESYLSKKLI